MKKLLKFLIYLSILIISSACQIQSASPEQQVLLIRQAINQQDLASLRSLSSLPLSVREQQWESASDGIGFVPGAFTDHQITAEQAFQEFFNAFLNRVKIEGQEVVSHGISLDLFKDELRGQQHDWAPLKLYLLKRGEADIEHIVLFGLDADIDLLNSVYIN